MAMFHQQSRSFRFATTVPALSGLESKRRVRQITVARTARRGRSPGHPSREAIPGDQNFARDFTN